MDGPVWVVHREVIHHFLDVYVVYAGNSRGIFVDWVYLEDERFTTIGVLLD